MKQNRKTKSYISNRLLSFSFAIMIVCVLLPIVASDPPETEEPIGPISALSIIPTLPGFRYDPNEYITITGESLACAEVHWIIGPILGDDDPWCDSTLFDTQYLLYEYGPNVHSYSEFIMGHAEDSIDCQDSSAALSADATMGAGYAVSANIRKIGFSVGTLSNSAAVGFDSGCNAGGASGSEFFNRPLDVVFPFFVSENGILFIEKAYLFLDGGASGYAEGGYSCGWSYDCNVHASWEIRKVGEGIIAGDTYSLSHFGFTDDYDGLREIPLPAGEYIFSASYDCLLYGGISVHGLFNNPATARVNALSRGVFDVELVYLTE